MGTSTSETTAERCFGRGVPLGLATMFFAIAGCWADHGSVRRRRRGRRVHARRRGIRCVRRGRPRRSPWRRSSWSCRRGSRRPKVSLLVDATGSMATEMQRLRESFAGEVWPGSRKSVPQLGGSIAQFSDPGAESLLFFVLARSTDDVAALGDGVDELYRQNGGDGPEGQVAALFILATGDGMRGGLPRECPPGTIGYACYPRFGARIVMLLTGRRVPRRTGGRLPVRSCLLCRRRTMRCSTRCAASARGCSASTPVPPGADGEAHLLDGWPRTREERDAAGEPIVRNVGARGERLPEGIVEGFRTFVEEAPLDSNSSRARGRSGKPARHHRSGAGHRDGRRAAAGRRDGRGWRLYRDVHPGATVAFSSALAGGRVRTHGCGTPVPPAGAVAGQRHRARGPEARGDRGDGRAVRLHGRLGHSACGAKATPPELSEACNGQRGRTSGPAGTRPRSTTYASAPKL